jgi:hypothetical protein
MSKWTEFVTAFYKKEVAKNADYKFKDAMKAAAKVYKKDSSSSSASKTMKKGKSKKARKSKKSRKH